MSFIHADLFDIYTPMRAVYKLNIQVQLGVVNILVIYILPEPPYKSYVKFFDYIKSLKLSLS